MERKSPRTRKLKMDRIQVERPPVNNNHRENHRQNNRKNSLPKINSPPRGDHRQVTAGGDGGGKMPRGYRARKSAQSNGPQPSPEETKLEMEKIKTLVKKPSNNLSTKRDSPIKPRSYDRVEEPAQESLQKSSRSRPEPKTTPKTISKTAPTNAPKTDSKKTETQSDRKPQSKPAQKVVQHPDKKSDSSRNRRKIQSNQSIDKSSKSEVSIPKPDHSNTSANTSVNRSSSKKRTKISNRSKNDPKMTADKKVAEKSTTSKTTKTDITKIDQSLAKNKRTNKTSRREVFDETKNPEQTIRTLMYEE